MRRVVFVIAVVLLLLLRLVVPVGMGIGMPGMPCPDCALSAGLIACLDIVLGYATIVLLGPAWRRLVLAISIPPGDGRARVLERPPK